jgi:uncharacterized protein YigE (DUF2233 family)
MKYVRIILFTLIIVFSFNNNSSKHIDNASNNERGSVFLTYIINPKNHNISMVWKDNNGKIFNNINNVRQNLLQQNIELIFAMNGGMYHPGYLPNGLYVENSRTLAQLDTLRKNRGYFYVQPNGVFYLTKEKNAFIRKTDDYKNANSVESNKIQYATQSGPMLVFDSQINHVLQNYKRQHIMNGVGTKSNGELAFVMSKKK